jgi:hypothetical protein
MRYFWEPTWCPGQPNGRLTSLVPTWRLSTMPLPRVWLRPLGYGSCSMSSRACLLYALLSTATTSVPCTSLATSFSINTPSMWRLISILSERMSPSVQSTSSMSRRHHSLLTSSRRVFPPRCSMSLDLVSIFAVVKL